MTDLAAALAEEGIRLRDLSPGERYSRCPNCSDQRKPANRKKLCLSVKVDDAGGAAWYCHNCEWKGNVAGVNGSRYINSPPAESEPKPARQPPAKPQYHPSLFGFFEKRGVSRETIEEMGIYFDMVFFPQTERKEPSIVFPYRFQGRVVNNKYRSAGKVFRQDGGAMKCLYNVDSLVDNDVAIFTEGENDVLALLEAGYPSVVSLPDGAPAEWKDYADRDDKRFAALETCAELVAPIKRWILAVDNDGPGDNLAHQLALRLGIERCFRPTWPDGSKDPNDVLVAHGADALRDCIDRAAGYPVKGLREFTPGTLLAFRNSPDIEMFGIGIGGVDRRLKWRPGQLVVVHGKPGDGKTTWTQWLAVNFARQYGWTWAVCSPEHEWRESGATLAEQKTGLPFRPFGLFDQSMTDATLSDAEAWIAKHFKMIVQEDEDEPLTLDFLLSTARVAHLRYGIRGLIIDPWNDLAHHIVDQNKTDYIGESLRRLKLFARHHDLILFLLVHPRKLERDYKTGRQPTPSMYDIADSAHFFNKCDIGLTVWRPDPTLTEVEILVHKVKRKDQGSPCTIKLDWERKSSQYRPIMGDSQEDML